MKREEDGSTASRRPPAPSGSHPRDLTHWGLACRLISATKEEKKVENLGLKRVLGSNGQKVLMATPGSGRRVAAIKL